MKNLTHEELLQEFERRVDIVKYMVAKDISDHREIWALIREYYKEPKLTAERVRKDLYGAARPAPTVVPGGEVAA